RSVGGESKSRAISSASAKARRPPILERVPRRAEQPEPREPEITHRPAELALDERPLAARHDVRVLLIELHHEHPARMEARADGDVAEAQPQRAEEEPGREQAE